MSRVLLTLTFLAGVGLLVGGFLSHPEVLVSHWGMQVKIKGLATFILVFATLAAAGYRYWPRWALRVVLGAGVVLMLFAAGVAGPIAVLATLSAALCTGDRILRWISTDASTSTRRDACGWILCCVVGWASLATLVSWTTHLHVHYPVSYAALLVLPIATNWSAIRRVFYELRDYTQRDVRGHGKVPYASLMLLWFVLGLQMVSACRPEVCFDSLSYHWPVIHTLSAHHCFPFEVANHVWAAAPLLGDWGHAIPYMFAGEIGAHLLNYAALVLAVVMLAGLCREVGAGSNVQIRLHVVLFAGTSLAYLVTGTMYVENSLLLYSVAAVFALVRFYSTASTRYGYVAAVCLGAAAATKMTGWILVAVCLLVLVCMVAGSRRFRERVRSWPQVLCRFSIVVLAFGSFSYVNSWLLTGNPVFPHFNAVFQSPLFEATTSFINPLYVQSLSLRSLFDLTFDTPRFMECLPGMMGYQYLLLVPLGCVALMLRFRAVEAIVAVVAIGFFCAVFSFQSYLRYLYPALGLSTVLMCAGVRTLTAGRRVMHRIVHGVLVAVLLLNLYSLPSAGHVLRDFPVFELVRGRLPKLRRVLQEYGVIQYLNTRYGTDCCVSCASGPFTANLCGRSVTWSWHSPRYSELMTFAETVEQIEAITRDYSIEFFVVVGEPKTPVFGEFLAASTRIEYREGAARIHRMK